MAIKWGSWKNGGNQNGMRLGYEFSQSPSSVGTGTSSVTVTLKLYIETKYSVYDSSNSYSVSGNFSASGSVNISHGGSGGTTLIKTMTRTVSPSYTGTVKSSFSASISGVSPFSGSASVSGSWDTGKRPISAPSAPSNVSVTRNSDTSHTIKWTNNSPTTTSKPYQNIEVQRWDLASNKWSTIATLGVTTSYTNTSTTTNNQYRWRVRSKNSAGASGYAYSGYWSTTPPAPGTPKASKVADDIKLTWSNTARKGTAVEVWHASNGVWESSRFAIINGNPTTWTHTNPDPTKTHTYKLKHQAGASDDAPNTYSSFSGQSNTIQLLTNPAAPTKLSPASGVIDSAQKDVVLTWQHNEIDGTDQTGYNLQYRLDGGSWTTVSNLSTGVSKHTFPAGTLPTGSVMDWQVRTYGAYKTAPAYSPWSAAATLTLSATPQAGVVFPTSDTPVDTSRVTAEWSYYDDEETEQVQYKVRLLSAGGASVLETRTGVGTATSVPLSTLLRDGRSYRIGVSVQDGSGLWSPETFEDFSVAYALPAVPNLTLTWDEGRAAVVATIENPSDGILADVDHNELWRSTDWETYELVDGNIPPNGSVTDYVPAIGVENVYKVVAVTEIEASAESEPVIFETPDLVGWFYINGGEAFSQGIRVRYNPTLSRAFKRSKALHNFAGRKYAVETAGEQRERVYDLSVDVLGDDDTTLAALESVADMPAPLVLRTPLKDRMFASLEGISSSREMGGYESVSMKLTQLDSPNLGTMAFDPVVYRTNWATDPSFTTLDKSLTAATGTREIADDDAYVGNTYLRVSMPLAGSFRYGGQWADVPEGYTYVRISAMARNIEGATHLRARLGYKAASAGTGTIYRDMTPGVVGTDWTRLVVEGVIPEDTTYVNMLVYAVDGPSSTATPAGSSWGIDAMCIELGTSAANTGDADYFDGSNYEGDTVLTARWTGEPNASTSQLTRGGSIAVTD